MTQQTNIKSTADQPFVKAYFGTFAFFQLIQNKLRLRSATKKDTFNL